MVKAVEIRREQGTLDLIVLEQVAWVRVDGRGDVAVHLTGGSGQGVLLLDPAEGRQFLALYREWLGDGGLRIIGPADAGS